MRLIHVDGKPVPADTPRSFLGYSVEHLEGDTLVVVTDHFNDRADRRGSLSHGLQLKVTERARRSSPISIARRRDPQNLITIEDPEHFTKPWTAEQLFPWRGDIKIAEYSCEENNRNAPVNGISVAK